MSELDIQDLGIVKGQASIDVLKYHQAFALYAIVIPYRSFFNGDRDVMYSFGANRFASRLCTNKASTFRDVVTAAQRENKHVYKGPVDSAQETGFLVLFLIIPKDNILSILQKHIHISIQSNPFQTIHHGRHLQQIHRNSCL